MEHNIDSTLFNKPWSTHVSNSLKIEEVIGNAHIEAQKEILISCDSLASIGPLYTNVKSKVVDEWIDVFIDKDLNKWDSWDYI